MPRLLIVHHSPSPNLRKLLAAVEAGSRADGIEGVEVRTVEALSASAPDVAWADGYLLGTPANLGYMSGALKHFFDIVYQPSVDVTAGRVFGLWVHGESDTTGAEAGVEKIVTGLRWRRAQPTLSVIGPPTPEDLDAAWELGAALAAGLADPG